MIRRWSNGFNWVEVYEIELNNFMIKSQIVTEWLHLTNWNSWEEIEKFYMGIGYVEEFIFKIDIKSGANSFYPRQNPAPCAPVKLHICNHEWKPYQGIIESYNYCTVCDAKER